MIKRFEHVGILVSDMERSLAFYKEVFGLQLRLRAALNEQVELAFLYHPDQPDFEVELIGGKAMDAKEGFVNHLAVRVENIDAAMERLKQLGVKMRDEVPRVILNRVKIAFFEGPDGEALELVERE
ncbi:VOC family protein [Fodinisporobacter ferrooxydans]|uniref:VOC family protein n=1 Tax=Fodinisporobacter ferrooxydans TaxID=2901836 RepID=A0ABY4CX03_9BACL|nr:VOC family protein [Alicyclobacillaceae bacterium MYW30-H2]